MTQTTDTLVTLVTAIGAKALFDGMRTRARTRARKNSLQKRLQKARRDSEKMRTKWTSVRAEREREKLYEISNGDWDTDFDFVENHVDGVRLRPNAGPRARTQR